MKLQQIVSDIWISRLRRLSGFLSIQIIILGLNVISGVLVLRTMEKPEYAFYTLAMSMQAAFAILSECGVTIGVNSIGGRVWNDPHRFGQLIKAAKVARYRLATVTLLCIAPLMTCLLVLNGCPLLNTLLLTCTVLATGWVQLSIDTLKCVPLLHSQVYEVQRLDVMWSMGRVVFLGFIAGLGKLSALLGMLITMICFCIQRFLLGKLAEGMFEHHVDLLKEDMLTINMIVNSQIWNALYYCMQSQITFFLLSIFGNTNSLADLGALSRFSVLGTLISAAMVYIVQPAFSKCHDKVRLFSIYTQVLGILIVLLLMFVLSAALLPDVYLFILGPKYANLKWELILVTIGIGTSTFEASTAALNNAKGWVRLAWLYAPVTIVSQATFLCFLNVKQLPGAIMFGILTPIAGTLLNFVMTAEGFREMEADNLRE